jgi:uncharacterized protein
MALFAISDLHLAIGVNKPMDVFGPEWADYMTRLRQNWLDAVGETDTVLMPGDFSWATYLPEALPDFQWLHALPGKKILTKGNHDYWWTTRSKLDAFLLGNGLSSIRILHNDAILAEDWAICGTRGWTSPGDEDFSAEDRKIYERELQRLLLSLQAAEHLGARRRMVLLHYPPFNARREPGGFVALMQAHGVQGCLYGHLHGRGRYAAIQGELDGIRYQLVAADNLQFRPMPVDWQDSCRS